MCLAAWALGQHERLAFVLAANRDEFYARPSAALARWQPGEPDAPPLIGGRDLAAGGTWMALREDDGRVALVTNVREGAARPVPGAPSRGALVAEALDQPRGRWPDLAWLQAQAVRPRAGWNLVLIDPLEGRFGWASNRGPAPRLDGSGIFGVSNAALDTPWPKLVALKARLAAALAAGSVTAVFEQAFEALADRGVAPDTALPDTGVGSARERALAPAFIHLHDDAGQPVYGTRAATVLVGERVGRRFELHVAERRFDAQARLAGETRLSLPLRAA